MNVAGFVRTVLGKPVVVVILVLVGLAAGAVGWTSATPHYESSGAVLVIPPGAGETNPGLNPFANLNETPQLANVVATAANAPDAQQRVAATGASPAYTLSTMAGDTSRFAQLSPQITFVVSGPDAETAQKGANALVDLMREKLQTMQSNAGVKAGTLADLRVSVAPTAGVEIPASSLRDAASYSMGAVGLVTILLLVGVASMQLVRRTKPGNGAVRAPTLGDQAAGAAPSESGPLADAVRDDQEPAEPGDDDRPPLPRRIAPPQRSARQRILRHDWTPDEEPLPEPDDDESAAARASRRLAAQVRWARPANRDDAARPRV